MKRIIIALLIPLLAVITVQICLKNPKTREIFTDIESYENVNYTGLPAAVTGEVTFKRHNEGQLELYFNGEKIRDFDEETLVVEVYCDGVFEIKNNSDCEVAVTVSSDKNNVITKIINTEFSYGISPICLVDAD